MKHNLGIVTEKITLKPMSLQECIEYAHIRNRQENSARFFTHESISDEAQTKWYESYLEDNTTYMFAAYVDDIFVGANSIYHISDGKAEHGRILVDKTVFPTKKGIGTAMIEAALLIAFNELGLDLVYAEVYGDNEASLKCHVKAGFIETERKRIDTKEVIRLECKKK